MTTSANFSAALVSPEGCTFGGVETLANMEGLSLESSKRQGGKTRTAPIKHVISVSRRTDIPCWYPEWFMNRMAAGDVRYKNPMGPQVVTVSLKPEHVHAVVFWTKDFGPMLPYMDAFEAYGIPYYTQFTLNAYPREYELKTRKLATRLDAFKALACRGRPVYWRYDPVIISAATPESWHIDKFGEIAHALAGYTERCHVSFVSMYDKAVRNTPASGPYKPLPVESGDKRGLLLALQSIAQSEGIAVQTCCDPDHLDIPAGACIDRATLTGMTGAKFSAAPTRTGCNCVAVRDIGAYNTCPTGCSYCYAVAKNPSAVQYLKLHDPAAVSMLPLPEKNDCKC